MDSTMHQLRYALRTLARAPAFTLTVLLTLAVGIGANVAVLSLVDGVLLRPLPYPDADRLVRVMQVVGGETPLGPGRLSDWGRMSSSFEALSGYFIEDVSDTTGAMPERVRGVAAAPGFLDVFGVAPALGRGFVPEDSLGDGAVVVISDGYWRTRFGGAPDVLRRTVSIEGRAHAVVGVMPADYRMPDPEVALIRPSTVDAEEAADRTLQWYRGIARLKPGVTLAQAEADLAAVRAQLAERYPVTDKDVGASLEPLHEVVVGKVGGSLWMLAGAVALLLLIACTNVAALLLTRAAERERQVALRHALGASRRSVAAMVLVEASLLAIGGAVLALPIACGVLAALRGLAPALPRLAEVGLDVRTGGYALACAVVVVLASGLLPALRAMRSLGAARLGGRTLLPAGHRVQWGLVGTQVALSVALLAGAGLLLRSVERLSRVDPGFDSERVLALRVSGHWAEEDDRPRLVQRLDRTLETLAAVPGVRGAATAWIAPGVARSNVVPFSIEGRDGKDTQADWRTVSPGYFATVGIPMVAGEACRATTEPGAPRQLMVNRSFASRYLGGRQAAGRALTWENAGERGRIVGVVADAREAGVDREPMPTVYACDVAPNPFPWILLRADGDPLALAASVRQAMLRLEPQRSVYSLGALDALIGESYSEQRLRTLLLTSFAVVALALCGLGVYGTLGYVVSLRRREIGLRMALGANRAATVRHHLGQAVGVAFAGTLAGVALALASGRAMSGMLYGTSPWDPLTIVTVVAVVLLSAAVAALAPALRASRVEPMEALREG